MLLSLVWSYPDEYDLLRVLASGDEEFVSEYLAQETGSILQFAKYGLLRPDSREFAITDVRVSKTPWRGISETGVSLRAHGHAG